jgi:hypothetical protein
MALIRESPLGVISGKIGQIVGATWKGINYVRVLPGSVANPQTDKQLAQRQKFGVTMHFLNPLSEFLQIGFRNYAVGMTGINAAFSYNIKNALAGTYPNIAMDYPNARVAQGNLPSALNQVASSTVAGTVKFDWEDNSDEVGAAAEDKTLLVVYNPSQNQAVTINELSERGDETQTITVPGSFSGDLVHCYIAFINASGEVSDSAYAGAVTVA